MPFRGSHYLVSYGMHMSVIEFWRNWRWHILLSLAAVGVSAALLATMPFATPAGAFDVPLARAPFPLPLSLAPEALEAEAAILYDPADGRILYQKNAELPLPLASLTKLMAADVVLSGNDPKVPVVISAAHAAEIYGSGDTGLRAGQLWSVGELIRYGLLSSSNNAMLAAASAMASAATTTVDAMNERARTIGLTQSRFYNSTGLDINASLSGGYGSALDVAMLAADFYRNHAAYFGSTLLSSAQFGPSGEKIAAHPTAEPILDLPGILAAKTGYTDLAHGNMVAIFDLTIGRPIVAVVLHSTRQGRFTDIRTLIEAARQAQ